MVTITLKGREIPLLYMSYEMKVIQEEIGPIDKALRLATGRNPEDDNDTSWSGSAQHIDALAKIIRIMGNGGLEEAGEKADLTDKWVLRAIRPAEIGKTINCFMRAMSEGMASEIPEKHSDEPVDVTLEEIKKKKEKED
jgi:hypothetical protein